MEIAVGKIVNNQQSKLATQPETSSIATAITTTATIRAPPGGRDVSGPIKTFPGLKAVDSAAQKQTNVNTTDIAASHADGIRGQEVNERSVKVTSKVTLEEQPSKSRRTPERTQSLREETRQSPEKKIPQRAQSFRGAEGISQSEDMKRQRFNHNGADEQLQKILNRRSRNLEEWEAQLAEKEVTTQEIAIREYEQKLEKQKQHKPAESIIDSEVKREDGRRASKVKKTSLRLKTRAWFKKVETLT